MPVRVARIGTGNVGVHALRALIGNPGFELTGVWVSSEAKAGKDAGELAGLQDSTGITATTATPRAGALTGDAHPDRRCCAGR